MGRRTGRLLDTPTSASLFLWLSVVLAACSISAEPESPAAPGAPEIAVALSPTDIDFGVVDSPGSSWRDVRVLNEGDVPIEWLALQTTDGSPFIAEAPDLPLMIEAGSDAALTVGFAPAENGSFAEDIQFAFGGDAPFVAALSVRGDGRAPGLSVEVFGGTDLGETQIGCSAQRSVRLQSAGEASVIVEEVALSASSAWVLEGAEGLPRELAPGEFVDLVLTWHPLAVGPDAATLQVVTAAPAPVAAAVSFVGTAVPVPLVTRTQVVVPRTDFLFVIRNDGWDTDPVTGLPELGLIAEGLQDFAMGLLSAPGPVDFRIAGMEGDGGLVGPTGSAVPPDTGVPLVLEPTTINWVNLIQYFVTGNGGAGTQDILGSLASAFSGSQIETWLLRPGARLLVVAVAEDDIDSDAADVGNCLTLLDASVSGSDLWTVHAALDVPLLIGGDTVANLVASHGGTLHDLHASADGSWESWSPWVAALVTQGATPTRFVPVDSAPLSQPVAVRLDAAPLSDWTFDPGSGLLQLAVEPMSGSVVSVDFEDPQSCPP